MFVLYKMKSRLYNRVPKFYPISEHSLKGKSVEVENDTAKFFLSAVPESVSSTSFNKISDFTAAYKERKITPVMVAKAIIENVRATQNNRDINAFAHFNEELIMALAEQSQKRYEKASPLSSLDGVPVAIKDQVDVEGYETNHGTGYWNKGQKSKVDDFVVAKLRRLGALIIGKTSMHELGFDVTNINPNSGICRNPYNLDHVPGGSSGGSAAAVAKGLCPLALGTDGGGSIRIPSSFCGIFGLKPTFGRVSASLGSVAHVGPMASCAEDLALGYFAMAGVDPDNFTTLLQPEIKTSIGPLKDLSQLKIGIYREYFDHSEVQVRKRCYEILSLLQNLGANVVDIEIPYLEEMRVAHATIIASEISASIDRMDTVSYPTQINSMAIQILGPADYVLSCKMRSLAMEIVDETFAKIDLIVCPSTACLAPLIPKNAWPFGASDLISSSASMRYSFMANLTGIPAISIPIGTGSNNLPIGLQFMANWWQEDLLINLAYTVETLTTHGKPPSYIDLLKNE